MTKFYYTCNNKGTIGYYGASKTKAKADLIHNKELYPDEEWEMFEDDGKEW